MFSKADLSSVQTDIFSAITYASTTRKRMAIFSQRYSGKSSALFTYLIHAYENNIIQNAVILVPSDHLVEMYLAWASIAFETVLNLPATKPTADGHVHVRRPDNTELHFYCVSAKYMTTYITKILASTPDTMVLVDEINAFKDHEILYLRLRVDFFVAVGSHDIENTLIGKLIGVQYDAPVSILHF